MLIAWTTAPSAESAQSIAQAIIENHLAACVQIDGPIRSIYRWDGKIDSTNEFRLTIKLLESQSAALETFVKGHHPYATPEWITVRAEHVGEKYLSWAVAVSTPSTL